MEPSPVAAAFALALLVGLPLMAAREEALEEVFQELSDRRPLYFSAALSLALMGGVTWGVAAWTGLEGRALGWTRGPFWLSLGWAAGATAVGLAVVWAVTRAAALLGAEESRAVFFLLPRDRRERGAFLLLALAAAVCEEYVYRGFALHVAAHYGGEAVAVAATALSFGLAHGYQKVAGVVRATCLGGVLAVPVVWTGSIFPAIVAHFWINSVIGLGGWRWLAPELGPEG